MHWEMTNYYPASGLSVKHELSTRHELTEALREDKERYQCLGYTMTTKSHYRRSDELITPRIDEFVDMHSGVVAVTVTSTCVL